MNTLAMPSPRPPGNTDNLRKEVIAPRLMNCVYVAALTMIVSVVDAQVIPEISLARTVFTPWDGFKATIGDANNDSRLEFLGAIRDSSGNLVPWRSDQMGVSSLFAPFRSASDTRIADLGSNGRPALIANVYSCTSDLGSAAKLFVYNGATYTEVLGFADSFDPPLRGHGETIVVADFDNDGDLDLFLPYYTRNEANPPNFLDSCPQGSTVAFPPSSRFLKNLVEETRSLQFVDRTASTAFGGVIENNLSLQAPLYSDWDMGSTPEAAQAVDFDNDGWIDLYVAGTLFMNRSADPAATAHPQFEARAFGLPVPRGIFDEGAKFLDWNNDGRLDLMVLAADFDVESSDPDWTFQLKLYEFDGNNLLRRRAGADGGPLFRTRAGSAVPLYNCATSGLNVADLNNDGLEDIIVAASVQPLLSPGFLDPCQDPTDTHSVQILLNRGGYFELADTPATDTLMDATGAMAIGDLDGDGRLDLVYPEALPGAAQMNVLRNVSAFGPDGFNISRNRITVEVLDANGRQNQFGRRIEVIPPFPIGANSSSILSRVVGSNAYLAQNQYIELIGTPFGGPHTVRVIFPTIPTGTRELSVTARAGDRIQFFAPSEQNTLGRVAKRFGSTSRFRDSDDDGRSDLFWRNGAGDIAVWKMNDLSFDAATEIAFQVDATAILAATADFDGDGKADLVWHSPDSGEVRVWTIDGSAKIADVRIGNVGPLSGWSLAGVGDFDGDGKHDLLWFNPLSGAVKIWPMVGVSRRTNDGEALEVLLPVSVDPKIGWAIAGVGDIDNDGISDIIWWNQADGRVNHWLMTSAFDLKPESGGLGMHGSPRTWKFAGVGDFNADGRTDILWKDDATGNVEIWFPVGLYGYDAQLLAAGVVSQWHVADVGDYNGDGRADILWRHDEGHVVVWRTREEMAGTNELFIPVAGAIQSVAPFWDVYPKR